MSITSIAWDKPSQLRYRKKRCCHQYSHQHRLLDHSCQPVHTPGLQPPSTFPCQSVGHLQHIKIKSKEQIRCMHNTTCVGNSCVAEWQSQYGPKHIYRHFHSSKLHVNATNQLKNIRLPLMLRWKRWVIGCWRQKKIKTKSCRTTTPRIIQ